MMNQSKKNRESGIGYVTPTLALSLLLLVFFSAPYGAQAATVTWDGEGGDGLWSTPLNWSSDQLPQPTDTIEIDTSNGSLGEIHLDIDLTLQGTMLIGSPSGILRGYVNLIVDSGVMLTLEESITVRTGGTLTNEGTIQTSLSKGVSAIGGSLINHGTITGVLSNVNTASRYINNGTMDDVSIFILAGTLENNGDITNAELRSTIDPIRAAIINNAVGATIVISGVTNRFNELTVFNNDGLVINNATIRNDGIFNNFGTFDNTNGAFELFCTPAEGTRGTFNNSGTVLGNPISISGDTCKVWDNDSGNGRWSDPTNWSSDALPLPTDTIIISGERGVNDTVIHLDTNFTVENELLIGNAAGLRLLSEFVIDNGATLTNEGKVVVRSNSNIINNGLIVNNALITQEIIRQQGSSTILNQGTLNNVGSIRLEPLPPVTLNFSNTGTIDNSGILDLSCGVSFSNTGNILGNEILGAICRTWDGGGNDGLWSNPLNWSDDKVPQLRDDIFLDTAGGDLGQIFMDVDHSMLGDLTAGSTTGIFTGSVNLMINSGKTFTVGRATLYRGANLVNEGLVTGNSGSINAIGGGVTNNATMTGIASNVNTGAGHYINNGTMNDVFIFMLHGTVENNGLMDDAQVSSSPSETFRIGSATFNNNDGAVVNITGPFNRLNVITTFNNRGTVTNSVTITNEGIFNNFGTFDNRAGAFNNQGTFNIECDSVLIGNISGNQPIEAVCDTPPVLTVPADITIEATSPAGAFVSYAASATDDTDGPITPTCVPVSGSNFDLGSITVTCTATDAAGNTASAWFTVTVVDTTPPVLAVPADFTAEANAVLSTLDIGIATATDVVGPVSISNNAPAAGFPLGTTEVMWIATDAFGNEASATQHVTVVDTTPPALTLPPDVTAEANAVLSTVAIGMATATDLVDGAVTPTSDAPAATFPLGTTTVTWTATDAHGNSTSDTQKVMVQDTTAPVLTVPDDVTVTATGPLTAVNIGTASATDIFPVTISNNAPAGGFPVGTTEVTWKATDSTGNMVSAIQQIHVVYSFGGFLAPVVPYGVYKAGRTLPVKIRAFLADGTLVPDLNATLTVKMLNGGVPDGDPLDIGSSSAADSGNTFRRSDDLYIFNLGTASLSPGMYALIVDLHDGSDPKFIAIALK